MRSLFANITSLSLPFNASAGSARIFMGPDLPAPLSTYVTADGYRYAAAIVFYGTGDDTTYTYIANTTRGGSGQTEVHFGQVVDGFVAESDTSGIPAAEIFISTDLGGLRYERSIYGELIKLIASGIGNIVIAGNGSVEISGNVVTLTGSPISLNSDLDWGGSVTVDGLTDISTSNTTSATYVTGSGPVYGATFVAPPSGTVKVDYYGRLQVNTAGQSGFIGPELRTGGTIGSGSTVTAANDQDSMRLVPTASTEIHKHGMAVTYSGLTPGATYNVALLIRATAAASVSVNDRRVMVAPTW